MTAGTPGASGSTARSRSWGVGEPLGLWALHVVLLALWQLALVALFFGGEFPDASPIWFIGASSLMIWFVYIVGPILVTRLFGEGPVADLWARIVARDIPVGLTIGAALQILVLPVVYWPILQLTDVEPGEAARDLVDRVDGPIDFVILALVVAIGAPLAEEFFYRGLLLQGLRRRIPDVVAVVVSSSLFALVHIDPILFPGTFVLGAAAAFATLRTGRLGLACAMHVGFNAATLVLLFS